MGMIRNSWVVLVKIVVVAIAAVVPSLAVNTYNVGDSAGWQPPSNGFNYTNWAAQHTFVAGDILIFDFITGQHTAAQITENAYTNCITSNPITIQTNGPANYTLTAGTSYFTCTIPGHCQQGQKLAVTAAPSSPGSPTGSPPAPPPPPPSSQGSPPPMAVVASFLTFLPIFMTFFSWLA